MKQKSATDGIVITMHEKEKKKQSGAERINKLNPLVNARRGTKISSLDKFYGR